MKILYSSTQDISVLH